VCSKISQTHTHTHTHTRALFFKLIHCLRRTACAPAQFSGCSSTTNAHSETGQMAVCCQNLTLGALSSRSALSVLVGALFKNFGLFLNTPRIVERARPHMTIWRMRIACWIPKATNTHTQVV